MLHATTGEGTSAVEASSYHQPYDSDENEQQPMRAGDGWQQPSSLGGGQQQWSRQLLPSQEESVVEQSTIWIVDSLSFSCSMYKITVIVVPICGMGTRYKAKSIHMAENLKIKLLLLL